MSMPPTFSQLKRAGRDPTIRIGIAMIVVIWASLVQQIARQSAETYHQAVHDNANLTHAFEESVTLAVKQVDINLHFLRAWAAGKPESQWGELLASVHGDPDVTVQMALVDRHGLMVASTLDPHPKQPVDLSDREHVRVHLGGGADQLFISKPLVGRVSKKWAIQLSRPILGADGELIGVAVGSLDPQHFVRFFEKIELGPESGAALIGLDGVVRAGVGVAKGTMSATLAGSAFARDFATTGDGNMDGELWDGREKITAWRSVRNIPLVVAISTDSEAVAADNRATRTFLITAGALISLLISGASGLLARDRFALKRTQTRLARSERRSPQKSDRLDITLESMTQGIVMADGHGRIVVKNNAAKRLLHLDGLADVNQVNEQLRALVIRSDSPTAGPTTTHTLTGGTVIKVATVSLPEGGFVAVLEDITELQRRHDDLVEAKAAADAANQAKTAFLANMSHEIRTPMNGVIGMAEVLHETRLDAEQLKYVDAIAASGAALLVIINDMLDFSKIEAGKLTIEPKPFDLLALSEDVVTLVSGLAAEKGVEIVLHYDCDLARNRLGDFGRIRQILVNLIGNAVKFTPAGHILVGVRAVPDGAVGEVVISITDTGIGIAADRLGQIFEEFVQLGSPKHNKLGGTGLGLAISQRLAMLMGGRISVRSTPGVGSTFTLTLPMPEPVPRQDTMELPAVAGRRALLVDDLAASSDALADWLRKCGMTVATVSNGEQALSEIAKATTPYDLVLIDIELAGADGITLGHEIASRTARPPPGGTGPQLVLLASMGSRGKSQEQAGREFAATLVKPLRIEALMDILRSLAAPACDAGAEIVAKTCDAKSDGDCAAASLRPRRLKILAAEDGPTNRLVLASMLKAEPVDLFFSPDGIEAVAIFEAEAPDVVLMDVWMPGLDGFEATARIRAIELERGSHRTPIIALTANAVRGDRERCIAHGMDDYMSKPIVKKHLLRMIARWGSETDGGTPSPVADTRPERRRRGNDNGSPNSRWKGDVPFLDEKRVSELAVELGDTGFAEVVAQFEHDMQKALSTMSAPPSRDRNEIRDLIHLIRGCASNLGVSGIVRLCDRIRADLTSGDVDWERCIADIADANVKARERLAELAATKAVPMKACSGAG